MGTFLCFAKETYPKERRPCCLRPLRFAAGQPGVLVRGVRRGTHCAPAALRSNNHGESVDEAGVSCGTPATPRPARLRRIQRGGSKQQGRLSFGYVSLLQRNVPKRRPCSRPLRFAAGQPGVLVRGVRRGTHCAPAALRSNNHGESVDEAGVSCGTPATRALRASGASRRGGEQTTGSPFFWVRFFASPKKRTQKATLISTPSLRCGATWGARARGAPWNSLRACGAPFKQPRRVS